MEKYTADSLTIALPKGKLFSLSSHLFEKIGITAVYMSEKSRKLVISNDELKVQFIISKTSDVPTYVRMYSWNPGRMSMSCWTSVLESAA